MGELDMERFTFIERNKLWHLTTYEVIKKIFSDNIIISTLAKEELLKRNLDNIEIDDEIVKKVISKLSIEQVFELMNQDQNGKFALLAKDAFDKILEISEKINRKAYLDKVYEDESLSLRLIKK